MGGKKIKMKAKKLFLDGRYLMYGEGDMAAFILKVELDGTITLAGSVPTLTKDFQTDAEEGKVIINKGKF